MSDMQHLDRTTSVNRLHSFATHWAGEVKRWRATDEKGTEKKYAQSFWADLLHCFGIIAARQRLFERDAVRATTGRKGWIDFFMTGVAIGEAKCLDAELTAAARQVDDYLSGSSIGNNEFPRYAILTNFSSILITKLDEKDSVVEFSVEDIAHHYDDLVFLIGLDVLTKEEEEKASIKAAELMANLYVTILGDTEADEGVGESTPIASTDEDAREAATSILMTRLLFLLYGDDAGLWERDLFYRWVEQETTAASLGAQLGQLFQVLDTAPSRRSRAMGDLISKFPYVNGSIFADAMPPEFFTPESREALLAACRFQWTSISVSVFGGMFQLVKSKAARRASGEHYTSEANILKTIGPLFLDHYRNQADRLIKNKTTTLKQFDELLEDIASNIYCDPACGSGNFLNLAYAQLREIETQVIVEKRKRFSSERGSAFTLLIETEQRVRIDQFYGFEIGWWPAKIAETSMFLVDHQANQKLAKAIGYAPERFPIEISAQIIHANALQLDWSRELPRPSGNTYIFGNPPFLGDHTRTPEQLKDLQTAWGTKKLSRLDYVTGWHAKCLDYFKSIRGEFAFVTTNSITQGDQTARLFEPLFNDGWTIKFAHRTFKWDSQAPGEAAVHCVIIGFTRDSSVTPRLWDYEKVDSQAHEVHVATGVNAYLIDGKNILVKKRSSGPLSSLLPSMAKGSMPTDGGNLVITPSEYDEVVSDPIAAKYLRPYIGSTELVNGTKRWCLWLEHITPNEIRASEQLRTRIERVKTFRATSDAKTTREYEHHHLFRQSGFTSEVPYVAVPEVGSSARRFLPVGLLMPDVLVSNKVYAAVDPSGLLFALLSSSMFITWMKAVGGRLKSDISFSSTITWNNFPLPDLSSTQQDSIIEGGQAVLNARALHSDRPLAEHYSPLAMDPALLGAHRKLDRAVDRAFGSSTFIRSDRDRLEILFNKYLEFTGAK